MKRQQSWRQSMSRSVRRTSRLTMEVLERRELLDASGVAGNVVNNDCPPDLDLSGIPAQTISPGGELSLDLLAAGGIVSDVDAAGNPTGDTIRLVLDPDDNPAGATLTEGVLGWTPAAGETGPFTFVVIAVDAGTTPLADAETIVVTVANAPPVVDLNGEDGAGIDFATTFTEGEGAVRIVDVDLSVRDSNGGNLQGATVVITDLENGDAELLAVDLTGVTAITQSYDASTGTLTLEGDASAAEYQSLLRTLTYDNASQNPLGADRVVAVTVTDGDAPSVAANATVGIIAVNDAPDLAVPPSQALEVGQTLEVTVTAVDPENDALVFLLDRDDPAANIPDAASITLGSQPGTAVIRWETTATDVPGTYTFVVLVVDDGNLPLADREEFTVTLTAVTTVPPVVDLNGAATGVDFAATHQPGGGPVGIVDVSLIVTDVDSPVLTGATIQIDQVRDAGSETLAVALGTTTIQSSYDASQGTLTLTGDASPSAYEQVLRSLTYDNTAANPDLAERQISVTVSDAEGSSLPAVSRVTFASVNLPPEIVLSAPFDVGDTTTVDLGASLSTTVVVSDDATASGDLVVQLDFDGGGLSNTSGFPSLTELAPGTFSLQWTPLTPGTYSFAVEVEDEAGERTRRALTVTVPSP